MWLFYNFFYAMTVANAVVDKRIRRIVNVYFLLRVQLYNLKELSGVNVHKFTE